MIAPQHCRAARGWLGWSQAQLAEKAGVGQSTVKDFEAGRRTPIGNNMRSIEAALEEAGIVFMLGEDHEVIGLNGPSPD